MRSLLIVIAIIGVLCVSSITALPVCSSSTDYYIKEATGQFGCSGITASKTITWTFSDDKTRVLDIMFNGYQGSALDIVHADRFLRTVTSVGTLQITLAAGGNGTLTFYTGPYTLGNYGLTINMKTINNPYQLTSGQTYNLQKEQQGGFVYFSLPWNGVGQTFTLDVNVYSYQGLQSPSVYVSINTLPTLESYAFTNATVPIGNDTERCVLFQKDPADGVYYIGVFLYGSTARISVNARWTFGIQRLDSGVKVASSTDSTVYYQVNVPVNAQALKFQISRQVPGGYPIAYITEGTLPASFNYEWIADTNTQSYISLTIPNPNPAGSGATNPGNYIIAITAYPKSGYIIQCDW